MAKMKEVACPCGSQSYDTCCARFIVEGQIPNTAEQLMRSRYSAYVLGDEAYLRATWHVSTCPQEAIINENEPVKWLGLEVRKHVWQDGSDQAQVEFIARYKVQGRAHRLHENSDFVREGGRWFYVSGEFINFQSAKPTQNLR